MFVYRSGIFGSITECTHCSEVYEEKGSRIYAETNRIASLLGSVRVLVPVFCGVRRLDGKDESLKQRIAPNV